MPYFWLRCANTRHHLSLCNFTDPLAQYLAPTLTAAVLPAVRAHHLAAAMLERNNAGLVDIATTPKPPYAATRTALDAP